MSGRPNQNVKDPVAQATWELQQELRDARAAKGYAEFQRDQLMHFIRRAYERILGWNNEEAQTCKLCGALSRWSDPNPIQHDLNCIGHEMQTLMGWRRPEEDE